MTNHEKLGAILYWFYDHSCNIDWLGIGDFEVAVDQLKETWKDFKEFDKLADRLVLEFNKVIE